MTGMILIACECSGVIRDAMLARGIPAISCDLKPSERPGPHIMGDIRDVLWMPWAGLVAHPECRYLANSGAKHLYLGMRKENGPDPERWAAMEEAAAFFRLFLDARHIPFRAVENPVMHGHARALIALSPYYRRARFTQPWHHGDPFFKATGFNLVGLPDMKPTNRLTPPKPGTPEHKAWSAVHRAPPGPERTTERSRTYPGIAAAVAEWFR